MKDIELQNEMEIATEIFRSKQSIKFVLYYRDDRRIICYSTMVLEGSVKMFMIRIKSLESQ